MFCRKEQAVMLLGTMTKWPKQKYQHIQTRTEQHTFIIVL